MRPGGNMRGVHNGLGALWVVARMDCSHAILGCVGTAMVANCSQGIAILGCVGTAMVANCSQGILGKGRVRERWGAHKHKQESNK